MARRAVDDDLVAGIAHRRVDQPETERDGVDAAEAVDGRASVRSREAVVTRRAADRRRLRNVRHDDLDLVGIGPYAAVAGIAVVAGGDGQRVVAEEVVRRRVDQRCLTP